MNKIVICVVAFLAHCASAFASPASLPAKAVIKGGEKLAAKIGLLTAGGGTALRSVVDDCEAQTGGEIKTTGKAIYEEYGCLWGKEV